MNYLWPLLETWWTLHVLGRLIRRYQPLMCDSLKEMVSDISRLSDSFNFVHPSLNSWPRCLSSNEAFISVGHVALTTRSQTSAYWEIKFSVDWVRTGLRAQPWVMSLHTSMVSSSRINLLWNKNLPTETRYASGYLDWHHVLHGDKVFFLRPNRNVSYLWQQTRGGGNWVCRMPWIRLFYAHRN